MEVCEYIVTCAFTRGSTMKFLPVVSLTASMMVAMFASLNLGVMRCPFLAIGSCADAVASVSNVEMQSTDKRSSGRAVMDRIPSCRPMPSSFVTDRFGRDGCRLHGNGTGGVDELVRLRRDLS